LAMARLPVQWDGPTVSTPNGDVRAVTDDRRNNNAENHACQFS